MRVRIVSYEDINAWILGKFARKMKEELLKLGVQVDIANDPDDTADINHHIVYLGYKESAATSIDTLMITHIDDRNKLNRISDQMKVAKVGICMSAQVMNELASVGIAADKLAYITPAHDNVMKPRKMVIGITSRVYPDGCKREELVAYLFKHISPDIFSLSIMGAGWDKIVEDIRQNGFTVNYYEEFDYDKYVELVPSFDYYLYTGMDEGSMGFIDALAAGVKTIVTPQGYHLDAPGGMTHSFVEADELVAVFKEIEQEKRSLMQAVGLWTWKDYAIKHLEIWNYLLSPQKEVAASIYPDGLNSLIGKKVLLDADRLNVYNQQLKRGNWRKLYHKVLRIRDVKFMTGKVKQLLNKFIR